MSARKISKADAAALSADIRDVWASAYSIASESPEFLKSSSQAYAFLGGLEVVLKSFIGQHCDKDAANAILAAVRYVPTDAEVALKNAERDVMRARYTRTEGAAS